MIAAIVGLLLGLVIRADAGFSIFRRQRRL
jgi:hypothetical protein